MTTPYIIEFDDLAAGVLAPDGQGYRFHYADKLFAALDGQFFTTYRHAERAVRKRLDASRRRGDDAQAGQR